MSPPLQLRVGILLLFAGQHVAQQDKPIEVQEGSNFTLQYDTLIRTSLEKSTVDCSRMDLPKSPLVFVIRKGPEPPPQMEQYRNRVSVNPDDLSRGVVTLSIAAASQSDSGRYRIYTPHGNKYFIVTVTKPQRDGTQPDGTQPDGTQPDGTQPDGTQPDGTQPDGTQPGTPAEEDADRAEEDADRAEEDADRADGPGSTSATPRNHFAVLFIPIIAIIIILIHRASSRQSNTEDVPAVV